MKIVKAGHEHISKEGLTPYQFVEKIGRTCYKSEDKVTDNSAEKFVRGLVKRGHTAMIEHFWVHMIFMGHRGLLRSQIDEFTNEVLENDPVSATFFRFMQVTCFEEHTNNNVCFISFPVRAMTDLCGSVTSYGENGHDLEKEIPFLVKEMMYKVQQKFPLFFNFNHHYMFKTVWSSCFSIYEEELFLKYIKERGANLMYSMEEVDAEIMKHATHTVRFTCDRGVSHELVRHRPCSFAQESTRYCNYGTDGGITVIQPFYLKTPTEDAEKADNPDKETVKYTCWTDAMCAAETNYLDMLYLGATPQEARCVLPNSLKTEVIMTANEVEWQHIVNLRAKQTTGKAHPQMVEIMMPWYEELKVLSEGRIW